MLPNGQTFHGAGGLRQILLREPDAFARCLGTKLFTYALGRRMLLAKARGNETFSQLIEDIVTNPAFEERPAANAAP